MANPKCFIVQPPGETEVVINELGQRRVGYLYSGLNIV
jgi:hypothetical protein